MELSAAGAKILAAKKQSSRSLTRSALTDTQVNNMPTTRLERTQSNVATAERTQSNMTASSTQSNMTSTRMT